MDARKADDVNSVVVAGGAGFIGSHFARLLVHAGYERVRVFDKFTYAGNPANLADLENSAGFSVVRGDICNPDEVRNAVAGFDAIVNFAAESHVDRSLMNPGEFIQTDVYGVYVLLEAARELGTRRFVQVSTDEVYGDVAEGFSRETDPIAPRNPYSAAKAGGDMLVRSYVETYGLPAMITRGSNTYGPYQYPEKILPVSITNVLRGEPILLYGAGDQVRDWLHAEDHASGIELVLRVGEAGEIYNIGGGNERANLDVATLILDELDAPRELIHHVTDRTGHDRRYALDTTKIRRLGWAPRHGFDEGIRGTVDWYRDRTDWWVPIRDSPDYQEYFERNYGHREVLKAGQ